MPSDQPVYLPAINRRLIHKGMVWDLVAESFEFGGETLTREFIDHSGAVAVMAINDDDQLLVMKQYRRPVNKYLLELPAGLLDVPGESELDCAKRELAEEARLEAISWDELISFHTTPGGNSELITVFVARGLTESSLNYAATGEERDMTQTWLPMAEAVSSVLAGQIKSPSAVVGIMAYALKFGISAS
jgi:ADP-ribose pyrophosphatase